MPLSAPIALGATAEVYSWNDGQVLKLFNRGVYRSTVEYEANLTRIACASRLPVPAVGEIVEIDGRFGLVYERVEGISMLEALMKKSWRFSVLARQLAELQAAMHKHRVPEMPSQLDRLRRKIKSAEALPENVRQSALRALDVLPEDDKLCHGDFHPGNILLTSRGRVIIDWIDSSRGSPLMDVARSTLLIEGGPLPPGTPRLVGLIRRWFYLSYIRHYFRLNPRDRQQLSTWIQVAAAARLEENITADETRLLAIAHRLLE
jgi:uncharacterized protein (TIGR02172 family)